MPEPTVTEPTETVTEATPTPEARSQGIVDDELLREAGRNALQAERRARAEAEKAAKAMQAELDRLREATASEAEKALLVAKREERDRILAEVKVERDADRDAVRAARLETAIVRQAIARFHDLDDVLGELLRDETVVMGPDGKFVGIAPALTALEKRKPHWVKSEASQAAYGAPAAGRSSGSPGGNRAQEQEQARQRLIATGRYSM